MLIPTLSTFARLLLVVGLVAVLFLFFSPMLFGDRATIYDLLDNLHSVIGEAISLGLFRV